MVASRFRETYRPSLVAVCDLGHYADIDFPALKRLLQVKAEEIEHRRHIRHCLDLLTDYLKACDLQGLSPLRYTVGMLARQLREYRITHKFWKCV